MKKKLLHIFLLSSILIFQFCNSKKDIKSENKTVKQELKILLTDPVLTLDPLQILYTPDWKVATNIFESLVAIDKNGKIIPELAESFFISSDKKKYTFKLKDNIYFQDSPCFKNGKGRKLNSFDVKFTFERLANPVNKFSYWQMLSNKIIGINKYHNGIADSIKGIVIEDSLTISFLLSKPFGTFLKILTTPNCYIIPKEAVKYFGKDFKSHPVGTGPFRISEFRKYKKIQLVKNENYYQTDSNNIRLPYINSICYKTIGKTENKIDELIKKNTDIISINKDELRKLEKSELLKNNYKIITLDKGMQVRYWGFNFTKNSLTENIRLAIAQSFNRNSIYDKVNKNKLAQSLVPSFFLKNKKFYWYNYKNSLSTEKLLRQIKKDTLIIFSSIISPDLIELENAIKRVSIPFKRIIKKDNYYLNIVKLKPDLFRVSMFPSYPDPIEYYSLFYSKSSNNVNLGGFKNSEYDKIFEKILYESNESLLIKYYTKLEQILKEEVAAIYLTHQGPTYFVYPKNLNNIKFKYNQLDFRKAYFE